jgi:hypothetical protein
MRFTAFALAGIAKALADWRQPILYGQIYLII